MQNINTTTNNSHNSHSSRHINRKTIRRRQKDYSIIFFDDMEYNIDDMKNRFSQHIECVYLPHKKSDIRTEISGAEFESNSYVEKVEQLDPQLFQKTTKSFELDTHKPILYDWINAHAHRSHTKIVIFDWDHALSVTNGVFPPNAFDGRSVGTFRRTHKISYQTANIHLYDIAVFLMGGQTRLSGLISMFRSLRKKNCNVFILTANNIANTQRKEFLKVIQVIIPNFKENHLVCSANMISKSHALLKNPEFQILIGGHV